MLAALLFTATLVASALTPTELTPVTEEPLTINFDCSAVCGPKLATDLERAIFVTKFNVVGYQLDDAKNYATPIIYSVNDRMCDADLSRDGDKVAALLSSGDKRTFKLFDWGTSTSTGTTTAPAFLGNNGLDYWKISDVGDLVATAGKKISGWRPPAAAGSNDSDFVCELGLAGFDLINALYAYVAKDPATSEITIQLRDFVNPSNTSSFITLTEIPCKINWLKVEQAPPTGTPSSYNYFLAVTYNNAVNSYTINRPIASPNTLAIAPTILTVPVVPNEKTQTYAYNWGVSEADTCSSKTDIIFRETPFDDTQDIKYWSFPKTYQGFTWQFTAAYPNITEPQTDYIFGRVDKCDDFIESFTYQLAKNY